MQGAMCDITDPNEYGHVHDVAAAVALINLWEAAKCRGAVAMRWDGQRWVVSIAGKWEEAKGDNHGEQTPPAKESVRVET
jgi:hypothetical protein